MYGYLNSSLLSMIIAGKSFMTLEQFYLLAVFLMTPLVLPKAAAETSSWELDWEWIDAQVQTVEEATGYTLDTALAEEELQTVLNRIPGWLEGADWDRLAAAEPWVQQAEEVLSQSPQTQPLLDWLRQRTDYFEYAKAMASQPQQEPPHVHPRPSRPHPNPHGPVIAEAPPIEDRSSTSTASSAAHPTGHWHQIMSSRPEPKGARPLVQRLKPLFVQHAVPEELIWLAEVESTFNPRAVSPAGAKGLFQFMPATAEAMGLRLSPRDERYHPEKSADAAARYLASLYQRFDNWPLSLAAYNAGQGRVAGALRRTGGSTFSDIEGVLPVETRLYVPKVIAAARVREGLSSEDTPHLNY